MRDASDKSEEASASLKKRMEESGELELGPDDKEGSQIGRNQESSNAISKEPEREWKRGTESDGDDSDDANNLPKPKADVQVLQQAMHQLYSDPSFAVICSFFNKFAVLLGLKPQCFAKIESMFTSFHATGNVDRELIDLHLTLLRKLTFKSARMEVWEKYLLKFCSLAPALKSEYLQLERYGYLHTTAATKLAIFKALCESQFDFNLKFKDNLLNSCSASDLRLLPVGYDKEGLAYWYQQDADLFIRVYSAEQDDQSGGSWNLVAKSKEELENLVTALKSQISWKYLSNLQRQHDESAPDSTVTETGVKIDIHSKFSTKHGSLLDTYQDESSIKHKKTVKPNKTKKKASVEEESKKENSAPPLEIADDIPDEVKPFIDRRILPRRSARSAAINHLKELTSPKIQSGRKKRQAKKKCQEGQTEISKGFKAKDRNVKNSDGSSGDRSDDGNEYEGGENDDKDDNDDEDTDDFILAEDSSSSDDEFMPLSELKKRTRTSKCRQGKKTRPDKDLSDLEESEEDGSDDDQERKAKKERKKATDETLCMKCNKSSNPEVLLLCDLCDEAWHTWCLHPMLWFVPDDDWFCPNCNQAMLVEKFSEVLVSLAEELKRKAVEDKKKEAAAERLKREMEYIGVSLNNIIDTVNKVKYQSSDSSEERDEDDGERKSKKKAIRRLGIHPQKPVIPIALSRSRRHIAKVDYNFGAYDELIQEAVKNIDESAARQMSPGNSQQKGGAGRGKDMANIINAEKKRLSSSVDDSCDDDGAGRLQSKVGKPARSRHRLNDLNVDEMTESDTDEYQASEDATVSDPTDDTDEYIPSDTSRRRVSKRNYSLYKRTQSDDDFVVSGSESEYEPSRKKSRKSKYSKKTKGKKRRGRWISSDDDSTSELSDNYQSEVSSTSGDSRGRRRTITKWAPRASSSDAVDSDHSLQRTASGRPLRKAVAKRHSLTVDDDEDDDNDNEEDEKMEEKRKAVRPVGTGRKVDSSDEFEPDEEEEEDDVTGDEEEMIDKEMELKSTEEEDESDLGTGNKVVKDEKDEAGTESTHSSSNDTSVCDKKKQASAEKDVSASTSDNVLGKPVEVLKAEPIEQEEERGESVNEENAREVPLKVEENTEVMNSAVLSSVAAAPLLIPPHCIPSTSTDPSSLNPSSVMEQMARLASSSVRMRQFVSPNTAYHSTLQTAPKFINTGASSHIFAAHVPVTVYQIRQPAFVVAPASVSQPEISALPQGWPPYQLPPSSFPSNLPPSSVVATTVSLPTTDSEALGNALASAMDC